MDEILEGVHRFGQEVFEEYRPLFERLARAQHPKVMFITCSDSRVVPNLITQSEPGDLFVLRNAGNIVPPHHVSDCGAEAAAIEYAVKVLNVQDIVVCGHSDCGAMKGLLSPASLSEVPAVARWLEQVSVLPQRVRSKYGDLHGDSRVAAMVEENVLLQLENLKSHRCVDAAVARGKLRIHGWIYQLETGAIRAWDAELS